MSKLFHLIFICFILFSVPLYAQEGYISGTVTDENNVDIVMAEIVLRERKDSILVKGVVTDDKGQFTIEGVKKGIYILQVHYLGYIPFFKEIEILNSPVSIGTVVLRGETKTLDEVVLTGRKPLIQKQINKTIVNIGSSLYKSGENGYRLFNVIPEIQADNTGNITFRGQEKVTVYLDGRKVEMDGVYLMNYLKSIPSEMINTIEINSVPSSEFDAANTGAIVNIITKKEYQYGLSGTVFSNFQQHRYFQGNGGFFMKYRKNNIIFQSNYSYGRGNGFFDNIEEEVLRESPVQFNQKEDYKEGINSHNAKIGFDYKLTETQTLGANYELNYWDAMTEGFSKNIIRNTNNNEIDSIVTTNNEKPLDLKNHNLNVFYRNKLNPDGDQLDIGYRYVNYDNYIRSFLTSVFTDENNELMRPPEIIEIDNPLSIDLHTFNIDLNKIIAKKATIKIGAKFSKSKTNNSIKYFEGESRESDTLRSNDFLYDEKILAFYSSMIKEWEKWGINIGLRVENTNYDGKSVKSFESISQYRWDIFPSFYLQHNIGDEDMINFSYGRRIIRPSYNLLNPFQDVEDPFFINEGNPELQPYFSDSFELSYSINNKYNFVFAYKRTTDIISNVYLLNPDLQTISTYDNINDEDDVLISFNTSRDINKWWNLSIYANARYRRIKINNSIGEKYEKITPYIWFNNRIKLQKNLHMEINGSYLGNSFYSVYDLKPQGVINFSFRKTFLEERLTVNLNFDDPFNLKTIKIQIDEADFYRKLENFLPTRMISVGVSYNLSKGKKDVDREYIEPSNENEINRLN